VPGREHGQGREDDRAERTQSDDHGVHRGAA
jgi:hypothetical protein